MFLLREAIDGAVNLPELENADSWIVRLLYDLLVTEERVQTQSPPGLPAV